MIRLAARNPRTGLLRAPLRLGAFFAAWYVCALLVAALFAGIGRLTHAVLGLRLVTYPIAAVLSIALAHVLVLRGIDRLSWYDVGLAAEQQRAWTWFLCFVLGAAAIVLPTLFLVPLGWMSVQPAPDGNVLRLAASSLGSIAPAALTEEFFARGYVFTVVRQSWGWKVALVATSIVFGVLHATNPNADFRSVAAVTAAGFFIGGVFLWTRSLIAAAALHIGWNWGLVALLHTPVSGLTFPSVDYRLLETGPDIITGGAWGPEGGLIAAVGMLLVTVYFLHVRRTAADWPAAPRRDPTVRGLFPPPQSDSRSRTE